MFTYTYTRNVKGILVLCAPVNIVSACRGWGNLDLHVSQNYSPLFAALGVHVGERERTSSTR